MQPLQRFQIRHVGQNCIGALGPVQIQAFQLGTSLKDSGNVVELRSSQPQVAKFWETGQLGEALVGDRGARQIQPNQHWL